MTVSLMNLTCRGCVPLFLCWALWAAGAMPARGQEAAQKAEKSPPAAEAKSEPAAEKTSEEPDPFAVPDGSPQELLQFIQNLRRLRPQSFDAQGITEFRKKLATALLGASEKILAQEAASEEKKVAVRYKISALNMLADVGDDQAAARLEALPDELEKAGKADLARVARGALLERKLRQLPPGDAGALEKLVGEVTAFLKGAPPGREEFSLAMTAAQMAEYTVGGDRAAEVYRTFGELLSAAEDPQLAAYAARMEGAARRLSLVGSPMKIEGITWDGQPFDPARYQGKVVLVDFWATWCGPCIAEMRHIRENYQLYHDRGFEVIGISVDRDLDALAQFVKDNELPWVVLADHAPKPEGMIQSLGDYYGVFAIPTLVLIGADGKVVALNPRGPRLRAELEKLLGPPETTPASEKTNKQEENRQEN